MTDDTDPESPDFVRVLRYGLALFVQFAWLLARLLVVGAGVLVAVLADPDRRTRLRRWFLLEGDRWHIVWLIVGSVTLITYVLSVLGVVGVANGSFVATTFGAFISGLFSFVPIVVAVNQLTVSRVFGTPSQVREQIEDVDAFRAEIENQHPGQAVSPTEPAGFLRMAIEVVTDHVDDLERSVENAPEDVETAVDSFVEVVRAQAGDVTERLDGGHQRLIEILPAMMGDSYSRNVNDARRIRETFGEDLPTGARTVLVEIEDAFVALDVLRQYFKALYLTQELPHLSRLVGYTGVGSFLVSVLVIMAFANGQPLGGHPLLLDGLLSLAVATVVLPFAVLLSFVVRVATIAKRTAAPGAFTPRRETPAYATHREP